MIRDGCHGLAELCIARLCREEETRDVFLGEIAAVVQWSALEVVIEPHYPKVGPKGGLRPFPLTDGNHVCANARGLAARLPLPKGPTRGPDNWYG